MSYRNKFKKGPPGGAVFSEARDTLAPWLDLAGQPLTAEQAIPMRAESREYILPNEGDVEEFFELWLIENVHGGIDPRLSDHSSSD